MPNQEPSTATAAHVERAEAVAARLKTDIRSGLPANEAEARYVTLGPNALPETKVSFWKLYIAPFIENWLVIIYLIAGVMLLVISIIISKMDFSAFTFVFVVVNAVLAIFQQVRAHKALKALRQLTRDKCTVIRGGEKTEIDATRVVEGDLLALQEGDKVPADARLVTANNLFTNEASLTGESTPIEKDPAPLNDVDVGIADKRNVVFMGSYVSKGNGLAIVVATGIHTEMGKIAGELSTLGDQEIPLIKKINNFAKYLGILVCTMFAVICTYNIIRNVLEPFGSPLDVLRESIIRAIQFMPINIILLVTVILYTGVLALAKKGVIVRKMSATDALGRISILCTDKTGTLTKNEMTVVHAFVGGKVYDVSGSGYLPDGEISIGGNPLGSEIPPALRELMTSGMLNGNAELVDESRRVAGGRKKVKATRKVVGDPVEAALHVLAEKGSMSKARLLSQVSRVREFPFDSELKRMTTVYVQRDASSGPELQVYTKGATEIVLGSSTTIMTDGGPVPLSAKQRDEITAVMELWSEKGYRTLGLAEKQIPGARNASGLTREEVEKELTFLGFLMIVDPLRPGVKDAVKACESAGVRVVMVTGDHPRTAKSIGAALGIWKEGDKIVEGNEIKSLDSAKANDVSIYARVDPRDKDIIVRRYQDRGTAGRVVAMTGDGVNDALALGMADVGIAMGISGTAIAKEAADMIITDDSFNTIELGIREGRALFAKIRTIIYFFIYTNLIEASFLFLTSFIPGFALLTAMQVYMIVGMSHAVPPLGLTFDRTAYEIMRERPRNEEEIFNKNTLLLMLVHMGLLVVGFLVSFGLVYPIYAANYGMVSESELAVLMNRPRSVALAIIMSIEVFTIFPIRRPNLPVWRSFRRDLGPILLLFSVFAYSNFVAAYYIPFLSDIFELEVPAAGDWLLAVSLGIGAVLVLELAKWLIRKYRGPF
ncbi:MAG: cation-transporting P-type ATPase [Candidatus Lokiarchaeota archaeon]|nr:cation-transporting P-type ATPase [Candidatus Lokiarchaeota archaeon]